MRIDYFVWCAVEVFVFNCNIYYSGSGSFYYRGTAADSLVYLNIRVIHFSLLQCSNLLLCLFFSFYYVLFVVLNLCCDRVDDYF